MLPWRITDVGDDWVNIAGWVASTYISDCYYLHSYHAFGQTLSFDLKAEKLQAKRKTTEINVRRSWGTIWVRNALFEVKNIWRWAQRGTWNLNGYDIKPTKIRHLLQIIQQIIHVIRQPFYWLRSVLVLWPWPWAKWDLCASNDWDNLVRIGVHI